LSGPREPETPSAEPLAASTEAYAPSVAGTLAGWQRAGGLIAPVVTAILAFFLGGLVVLATGHNPLDTYDAILDGTGLKWFVEVGNHSISVPFTDSRVWFPWDTTTFSIATPEGNPAADNLVQTLLLWTTLVFTGLAVAFAFRCGLFNIGGQGQYIVGAIVAVWVGSSWAGMAKGLHILIAIAAAAAAGALWAGIAGLLKATVGAHEVITTIMLNWIAFWVARYLVAQEGPLQNEVSPTDPTSAEVVESARLPVFWGDPLLQGLHVGFFIALGALFVYYVTLNRTTLGYEVRAVGFNPESARYGGISVARSYFLAMAISGAFAGLGGAMDLLGWQFRISVIDITSSTIGFIGIAVALLGRNTAVGVGLAALLFASLLSGTRDLGGSFPAELGGNLTVIIQALILLFVGADILILYLWNARRRLRRRTA